MILVSFSCDVSIRPGQLRVVLASKIIVRFQPPQKNNPPPNGRHGHFGPILGLGTTVFLKVDYFLGPEE